MITSVACCIICDTTSFATGMFCTWTRRLSIFVSFSVLAIIKLLVYDVSLTELGLFAIKLLILEDDMLLARLPKFVSLISEMVEFSIWSAIMLSILAWLMFKFYTLLNVLVVRFTKYNWALVAWSAIKQFIVALYMVPVAVLNKWLLFEHII